MYNLNCRIVRHIIKLEEKLNVRKLEHSLGQKCVLNLFYDIVLPQTASWKGLLDDNMSQVCGEILIDVHKLLRMHLALFSLRTESDNPDATCELSP